MADDISKLAEEAIKNNITKKEFLKNIVNRAREFLDWRITKDSIVPTKVGGKFTKENIESIKKQIEKISEDYESLKNIYIESESPTKISLYTGGSIKRGILDRENLSGSNKKQVMLADATSKYDKIEKDIKIKNTKEYIDNSGYSDLIDDIFGKDNINTANKKSLIKFLNGDSDKYYGIVDFAWKDGILKLNARKGDGIDWVKVKENINKAKSEPAKTSPQKVTDSTPLKSTKDSGIMGENKTKMTIDDQASNANNPQKNKDFSEFNKSNINIKNGSPKTEIKRKLQYVYEKNKELIDSFHKNKEIDFKKVKPFNTSQLPISEQIILHKSDKKSAFGGSPSRYGLVFYGEEPAIYRTSNHWGEFSTNIYEKSKEGQEMMKKGYDPDEFGRIGTKDHRWSLSGGDEKSNAPQVGIVLLKDIDKTKTKTENTSSEYMLKKLHDNDGELQQKINSRKSFEATKKALKREYDNIKAEYDSGNIQVRQRIANKKLLAEIKYKDAVSAEKQNEQSIKDIQTKYKAGIKKNEELLKPSPQKVADSTLTKE